MILCCGIILLTSYLFVKWWTINYDHFEKKGLSYIKPTLTFLFDLFFVKKSTSELVQGWYNCYPNEKIIGMFQFRNPTYLIRDPKLLKKMAVTDFEHFLDRSVMMDESIDKMFGKSLVSLRGQKWRDMRATLSPMFTGSKMRMMYDYVAAIGKQTAETMKSQIKDGSDNVYEFKDLAKKFTVDVIATCAFGIEVNSFEDPDNDFQKVADMTDFTKFSTAIKFFGYILMAPVMRFFNVRICPKAIDTFFQEAVLETMKIREEKQIVRHDMIHLLMEANKGKLAHEPKENEKTSEGFATVEESQIVKSQVKRIWDDDDIAAQCFLFFFAGFDTISSTMSFMAHELAVNPDVQQKLFEEISVMEKQLEGKTISYEQIQALKYMDQVVCETMRKWPAIPMTDRMCIKDYDLELDDRTFVIGKGQILSIPIYAFHRNPEFFPEPLKFDPERFSDENRANIDPDAYLPFGLGPRNCIGLRFALMELKTIIYYLLLNFTFEVTEKTQIPLQFAKTIISVKAEKGFWVAFKPRN